MAAKMLLNSVVSAASAASKASTSKSTSSASEQESSASSSSDDVYSLLAQKENDLVLAAELGKALLEKNEELRLQNDEMSEEFADRLEVRCHKIKYSEKEGDFGNAIFPLACEFYRRQFWQANECPSPTNEFIIYIVYACSKSIRSVQFFTVYRCRQKCTCVRMSDGSRLLVVRLLASICLCT